jgi:cation diffusion facilitator family transporter
MPENQGKEPSWIKRQFHKVNVRFILLSLLNGPLPREELIDKAQRFGNLFGVHPLVPGTQKLDRRQRELDEDLSQLMEQEFIAVNEQGAYYLTEHGIEKTKKLSQGPQKFIGILINFLSNPKTAAKTSIIVNILLSILKLVVGFLFNSIALIADAFDNLVDVLSASVVFLGIKYRKEFLATEFIILVMFGSGGWIGYESISRLIHPETVDAGFLTVVTAIISGLVFYLLSLYQHMIGKKTGSLALISQSIDSRHHVIVAGAILIGIVFIKFGISIVDSIVGLGVAFLLLKSAIELTVETFRIARGKQLDVSKFVEPEERVLEKYRRDFFKTWILFALRELKSKTEIVAYYQRSFSTEGLLFMDELSFVRGFDFEQNFDKLLEELISEGLVAIKESNYDLTDNGTKTLNKRLARRGNR